MEVNPISTNFHQLEEKKETMDKSSVQKVGEEVFQLINQSYFDENLRTEFRTVGESGQTLTHTTQNTQVVAVKILHPSQLESSPSLRVQLTPLVDHLIKAQDLLYRAVIKKDVSPQDLEMTARALVNNYSDSIADISAIGVIAHQLYEKAAELLLQAKDIEGAFKLRLQARRIPFPPTHPLYSMSEAISKGVAKQSDPEFGAHFSSFGTGVLKNGHLQFFNRNVEGIEKHCLYFDINAFARKDLQQTLEIFNNPANLASLQEVCKDIKVSAKPYIFKGKDPTSQIYSENKGLKIDKLKAEEIEFGAGIEFAGIGRVIIGNSPGWSLYNTIYVEIDQELTPGEGLKKIHTMLSLLGLGPILGQQKQENDRRMQMAQLFRAVCPQEAYEYEQTKEYFEEPISLIREKIEGQIPKMKEIFHYYLDDHHLKDPRKLMSKEEIYPGMTIWTVPEISEKMRENGAWGLMAGIDGSWEYCFTKACTMLKHGMLSSEDRFKAGKFIHGASSFEDLQIGSKSNFLRGITPNL